MSVRHMYGYKLRADKIITLRFLTKISVANKLVEMLLLMIIFVGMVSCKEIDGLSHLKVVDQRSVSLEKMYTFFTSDAVYRTFFTIITAQVSSQKLIYAYSY